MTVQQQIDALLALQGQTPVERELLDATASYVEPADEQGTNETVYVELDNGSAGFFKPFAGTSASCAWDYGHDAEQPTIHECAAWQLARILGAPLDTMVAACVLRSCEGQDGSLSARCPGEPLYGEGVFDQAADQCAAAAFFDCLIAQQDRHHGNALWQPTTQRLSLIDHGFSFARPGDYLNYSVFLTWRRAQTQPALSGWEHQTLETLLSSTLAPLLPVLEPARAAALRDRAQRMLATGEILDPGAF